MRKDRLRQLFVAYDLPIQTIISAVLLIEQEHISMERPRIKDQIEEVITRIASKELVEIDKNQRSEQ